MVNKFNFQFTILLHWEKTYEHTLPHLVSWSTNEVTLPPPTQNHHKNIHSMSSYHLISQNALAVILHLEKGGENLFWTWGGMFKYSVNMPWKHKSWGAKARRQKDDKKELMKQSKKFSDPASLWSLWNIRLFAFMPCSVNKSGKAQEPICRFSEGFRLYGKVKSTCDVLLLVQWWRHSFPTWLQAQHKMEVPAVS